ncbi:hypothetical protein M409DRAFT_53336 [Zasmidium cellare ATCC 36951]|uniref:Uncharacterized protein n=1 Tax=Zasmidium cellare ATCC 36951 TaxID=1080233 RepID=A0A6A6CLS9_ZASCE|nr:uncharacterized protein M409DRAFT_53336 [Zasmidium cellare ATCC 36951]KAF2168001.1 hypothetical protein M409DRAFT_53336 [Zasmidium cellare ATCC 36951]
MSFYWQNHSYLLQSDPILDGYQTNIEEQLARGATHPHKHQGLLLGAVGEFGIFVPTTTKPRRGLGCQPIANMNDPNYANAKYKLQQGQVPPHVLICTELLVILELANCKAFVSVKGKTTLKVLHGSSAIHIQRSDNFKRLLKFTATVLCAPYTLSVEIGLLQVRDDRGLETIPKAIPVTNLACTVSMPWTYGNAWGYIALSSVLAQQVSQERQSCAGVVVSRQLVQMMDTRIRM